jgi:hypothetical protein
VLEVVEARERRVLVICRSGNRSELAAHTLNMMGYANIASLRTGLRGWNDDEQPLIDALGEVLDFDDVDELFRPNLSPRQLGPTGRRAALSHIRQSTCFPEPAPTGAPG